VTYRAEVLQRFIDAVLNVEWGTGGAVGIEKAGETVVRAFIGAALNAELHPSTPRKLMAGSSPAMISSA